VSLLTKFANKERTKDSVCAWSHARRSTASARFYVQRTFPLQLRKVQHTREVV